MEGLKKSSIVKSQKYSDKFYFLAAAGVAGVVGGLYCLYSLFTEEEEELEEKEIFEIEEIKNEITQNQGKLSKDNAIHILHLINHTAEENIKKNKPDLEIRRREVINDEAEYQKVCMEVFEAKELYYKQSSDKILAEFNTNMEAINQQLMSIDQAEMEKKMLELEKTEFTEGKPNKEKSKEAFLYYGNKFLVEIQNLTAQFKNMPGGMYNPQAQEMAMLSLLVGKMKVEDFLYIKYKLNEAQIRKLLVEYELHEDRDVKNLQAKMAAFEQMMGGM